MGSKDIENYLKSEDFDIEGFIKELLKVQGVNRTILAKIILGVEPNHIIQEMFMGYKQRKQRRQLYSDDNTIPTTLISMYYELGDRCNFETLKNSFVSRYIKNESKIEGVHSPDEIEGMRVMYEYIHSDDIDYMFNVFTLKEIHEKLYSLTAHPEFGGNFRRSDAYIKGFPSDLVSYPFIFRELDKLDPEVLYLKEIAPFVKDSQDADFLLEYLDRCVVLGCELIRIHPFADGNGRSVRGFINKLLEDAGLPPVYITLAEKDEYREAMGKAIGDGDFSVIKNFYRYKICDSIVELDINRRIRNSNESNNGGSAIEKTTVKEKVDDLKRKDVE